MFRNTFLAVTLCLISPAALAVATVGSNTITLVRGGAPAVVEITITPAAIPDTQTVTAPFSLPSGVTPTNNQPQVNCTITVNGAAADFTVSNNPTIQTVSICRLQVQATANAALGIFPFQGAFCDATTCTLAPQAGHIEVVDPPATPPTLTPSPAAGSTITAAASGAFAPIVVSASGGSGTGAAATSVINNCAISGSSNLAAIANTSTSGTQLFIGTQPPGASSNITIPACVPAGVVATATLVCSQSIGNAPGAAINWPLVCPARTPVVSAVSISGQLGTSTSYASAVGVSYTGGATAVAAVITPPATGTLSVNPQSGGNGTLFNFVYTPPAGATQAIEHSAIVEIRENGALLNTVNVSISLSAVVAPGTPNPSVLPGVQLDPVAAPAIAPVAAQCASASANSELARQCALISASNDVAAVTQALRAVSSEELATVVSSGQDNLNFAANGAGNRLAALRGGATRQSVDDMAFNIDGQQVPMGALAALLGVNSTDETVGSGGLTDQRLGIFGQVLIRNGDRDALTQNGRVLESGFDFDGWQFLLGGDYRFSNDFVAGMAVGGGKIDADLDGGVGFLDTKSRSIAVYASFAPSAQSYVEFAYTHLRNKYDQARAIDLRAIGGISSIANGSTKGRQHSFGLSAGYSFAFGATSLTPNLRLSSGSTRVDGFDERGSSPFLLRLPRQEFESLQYALGVNLQHAVSIDAGVFAPFANFEYVHEQKDSSNALIPTFLSSGIAAPTVQIADSDSNFGRGEVGFLLVREGGWQFAASYSRTLAFDLLSSGSISLSGRVEF